jgi:DNA-binding LacI/PurR family transcriptional regulator
MRRSLVPTLDDIASAAGVSKSTASRAFSRPEMLTADTVARVREVADRLGYRPNQLARALSTGRQGNIAILVPDIANPFFPPLIRAVQHFADDSGFGVFIGDSGENAIREFSLASRLASQIEGLILASPRMSLDLIRQIADMRPTVLINRDVRELSRVLIDPARGMDQAVELLAAHRHEHVIYVSGPLISWSDQRRRAALSVAGEKHGVRIETIADVQPTFEGARVAIARLLATGASAAIAFDDFVAQGLLVGAAEQGVSIPGEFSLIGFDDVLGASTYPALTSVRAPNAEAGERAVALLIAELQSSTPKGKRIALSTQLIERDTTGKRA